MVFTMASAPNAVADDRSDCADAYVAGQQLRKDGNLLESQERLVVCARPVCSSFMQADCARWSDEVVAETPSIVLVPSPCARQELPPPRVVIDSIPVPNPLDGLPHPFNPGPHRVAVDLGGHRTEFPITLVVGERNTRVTLPLPDPSLCSAVRGPIAVPESGPNSSTRSYLPWGIVGVSLAAVGTALSVAGYLSAHTSTCSTNPETGCPESRRNGIAALLIGGNTAIGLGAIALGVAVVDFVVSRSRRTPSTAAAVGWNTFNGSAHF
jgi:hypothetical protein